ncbi:MAG: hypothetical protein GY768_01345 [Planctomycetaceae bacterium]|nr:hypothetical protein [Planctomycetaceae bacterium]
MRVLVFAPYAHWKLHVTDLELIQQHVDAGDDVTVLTCRGEMQACDNNPRQQVSRCVRCIGRSQLGLRLIRGSFQVASYYRLTDQQERQLETLSTDFLDHKRLQAFYLENFDIGWAVLSSLITRHRDPEVDLRVHAFELAGLMRAAWTVYYSLRARLRQQPVDRVYVFNGRYAPLRAAFRACQAEQTDCRIHDVGQDHHYYSIYENCLPHDHIAIAKTIQRSWEQGSADREFQAERWFEDRAQGSVRSGQCFVDSQKHGQLPENWSTTKRNVAIFTSSEDEFAAIGESWKNPLYESQLDGLQRIVHAMKGCEQTHLYVRVHPNLKGINNQQTRAVNHLVGENLTLLPAEDSVSTYALIRACDTVLTFGSTVGIEATYWRKPSVLAGIALYRELNATFNPDSHDQLISLLSRPLGAQDLQPALKYGYYQASFGEPYQHYQPAPNYQGRFQGSRLQPGFKTWMRSRLAKVWPSRMLPDSPAWSKKTSA